MKDLLEYLASTYYLALISFALSIVSIYYAFRSKIPQLKLLRAYTISYCAGLVLNFSFVAAKDALHIPGSAFQLLLFEDFAFTIFEITVFTIILYRFITDRTSKSRIMTTYCFYALSIVSLTIVEAPKNVNNSLFLQKSYLIQAIAMLMIATIYFVDIFRNPLKTDVSNEPSFWVASAISICLVCTIPATIIIIFLNGVNYSMVSSMYGIIHVFYGALFLLLIRALKCNPASL